MNRVVEDLVNNGHVGLRVFRHGASRTCGLEFRCILKGSGDVTVNKPVISIICVLIHTWQLCSAKISMDGVNQQ